MNTTILVISIVAIFLIVFDVYIIMKKGKFESISAHIIRLSKEMPLLVFCTGVLIGHFYWSMDSFDSQERSVIIKKCKAYMTEVKND